MAQGVSLVPCDDLEGGYEAGEREAREGGDVCTHIADSRRVQQRPTQHCKAIILQLKIN